MARLKGSKDKKARKSRGKSLTCAKGHSIAVVGRNSSGHCNECHKEYYRKRWEFIKKNYAEKPS